MSELQKRLLAGIFGVIVLIFCLYFNVYTYYAIMLFISTAAILEFYKLSGLDGFLPLKLWGAFTGACVFSLSFFYRLDFFDIRYLIFLFTPIYGTFFIKLYKKNDIKPFSSIAYTFLGVIYCSIPFALLNIIAISREGDYNYEVLVGIFFLHWASDTGAYFSGKKFGKRKLFERVSPKKSWEGSVGGTILAFIISYCLSLIFTEIAIYHWIFIAILAVVAGTYGDLIESLFKRSLDIKDSGTSIPGHGGFLDRFDGLFISLPFITAYHQFFM